MLVTRSEGFSPDFPANKHIWVRRESPCRQKGLSREMKQSLVVLIINTSVSINGIPEPHWESVGGPVQFSGSLQRRPLLDFLARELALVSLFLAYVKHHLISSVS